MEDFVLFIVFGILWAWPLVILHELGHAAAALLLTSGRVVVGVGGDRDQLVLTAGRLDIALALHFAPNGECAIDDGSLRVPKAEAWIAAAGPVVSLCLAVVLSSVALDDRGLLLASGTFVAWLLTLLTALPLRYGAGVGHGESDGRAIWRILTGGPPGGAARDERRLARPERPVRPAYVAALALVAVLAALVEPLLLPVLAATFGLAWLIQR